MTGFAFLPNSPALKNMKIPEAIQRVFVTAHDISPE